MRTRLTSDGHRSGFEDRLASFLDLNECLFNYESTRLRYTLEHTYKPDFILHNGIIIEAKGRFTGADRTKMRAVKEAHPDLDIRFIFQRDNRLSKTSKTTYTGWAAKHGFPSCVFPNIPIEWLN